MANGSAIFESLGASPHQLPLLWLAAPVSGLVIQPIVGYASDRIRTPLGRRRPFFLVGAILSSIALVLLPNSPSLWIAAGLLWLLDALFLAPGLCDLGELLLAAFVVGHDRQRLLGEGFRRAPVAVLYGAFRVLQK